jgi:glycosyltransferase involved in cell wall biosynthesis
MTAHGKVAPRIAIVDPMCQSGYGPETLAAGALGGTEATVIRVATALAGRFDIAHYQKGRDSSSHTAMGWAYPLDLSRVAGASVVIVINAWKVALRLRKAMPGTPILLWLHVFPGRHNRRMGEALARAGITVVCVSRTHAERLQAFLPGPELPRISFVHNPVDDALVPDGTPRQENLLLFASSPHKGLAEVFARFEALRSRMPDLVLALADPGYLSWDAGRPPEGVCYLGKLTHAGVVRQMRKSLCLFYPQSQFHETFGLVMAEANAVGTPVLVQRGLGANDEVVRDPDQRIDSTDIDMMHRRLVEWRARRPRVSLDPAFRLDRVADAWTDLLQRTIAGSAAMAEMKVA